MDYGFEDEQSSATKARVISLANSLIKDRGVAVLFEDGSNYILIGNTKHFVFRLDTQFKSFEKPAKFYHTDAEDIVAALNGLIGRNIEDETPTNLADIQSWSDYLEGVYNTEYKVQC